MKKSEISIVEQSKIDEMVTLLKGIMTSGDTIEFESEDGDGVEIYFGKILGGGESFKLWMNGKIVKMSKTPLPIAKKLLSLIEERKLEKI